MISGPWNIHSLLGFSLKFRNLKFKISFLNCTCSLYLKIPNSLFIVYTREEQHLPLMYTMYNSASKYSSFNTLVSLHVGLKSGILGAFVGEANFWPRELEWEKCLHGCNMR